MTSKLDIEHVRHYRACWDPGEVVQVLDALDRLGSRNKVKQPSDRRETDRKNYLTPVLVAQNGKTRLQDGSRPMLHVLARNLSCTGLGLLSPLFFEPEIVCREAPMLRAANIFREGATIDVGLQKPCGSTLWLNSTVIRSRTVQHDFLDVGLRFNSRIDLVEDLHIE